MLRPAPEQQLSLQLRQSAHSMAASSAGMKYGMASDQEAYAAKRMVA